MATDLEHIPAGMGVSVPVCDCHGVAMYWHKRKDTRAGGYWRCREKRKVLDAARWQTYYRDRMPTRVRYGPRYLHNRRQKALVRRRERQLRRDA